MRTRARVRVGAEGREGRGRAGSPRRAVARASVGESATGAVPLPPPSGRSAGVYARTAPAADRSRRRACGQQPDRSGGLFGRVRTAPPGLSGEAGLGSRGRRCRPVATRRTLRGWRVRERRAGACGRAGALQRRFDSVHAVGVSCGGTDPDPSGCLAASPVSRFRSCHGRGGRVPAGAQAPQVPGRRWRECPRRNGRTHRRRAPAWPYPGHA